MTGGPTQLKDEAGSTLRAILYRGLDFYAPFALTSEELVFTFMVYSNIAIVCLAGGLSMGHLI